MQNYENKINGYIEGFYGRLLTWENRKRIVLSLKKNKMGFYLYAPKEDIKQRLNWRDLYGKNWIKNFKSFTSFAKKNNIKIIAGISPGLDFNFNHIKKKESNNIECNDFSRLVDKSNQLLINGASEICLLLDDIPNDFNNHFGVDSSEGQFHSTLANKLYKKLNRDIYFVPRVYANELISESPLYLSAMTKNINPSIKIIYCGNNVVSKTIKNIHFKHIPNEIVIWDNLYANDYCPRRLFLGATMGRKNIAHIMFNLTGFIETDLLILDIISATKDSLYPKKEWRNVINNYKLPSDFFELSKFFEYPAYNKDLFLKKTKPTLQTISSIDNLLWRWHANIKLEWYPFLFGLKHDLLLNMKELSYERIVKTQSNPLANVLIDNKLYKK